MLHAIFPSGSDGINTSGDFRSNEFDDVQTNNLAADIAISGSTELELSIVVAFDVHTMPKSQSFPLSIMSTDELLNHCVNEIGLSYQGELQDDTCCVELFRRATLQKIRMPGELYSSALAKRYVAGWMAILINRRRVA